MLPSTVFADDPACLSSRDPAGRADALVRAAESLLPHLARGATIDAGLLRAAMIDAFGAHDSDGAWTWKGAYEACEAAQILFLRRFGPAMRSRPAAAQLAMLTTVAALLPSQTRRSEESQALQQFSTRCRSPSWRPRLRRSGRATSCWNRPPARGSWPSSRSSRAPRSC